MPPLKIKIKYLRDVEKITKIDIGDWIDLRTAERVYLPAQHYYMIPLGVAMKLPKGYEAHIVPRSSTFSKYGIIQTNHMGVIDESYCGENDEWMFPVYTMEDSIVIPKNTRLCQFRIMKKMEPVVFEEVEKLSNPNRGGFGSTGDK